jgi:hypothetical protein
VGDFRASWPAFLTESRPTGPIWLPWRRFARGLRPRPGRPTSEWLQHGSLRDQCASTLAAGAGVLGLVVLHRATSTPRPLNPRHDHPDDHLDPFAPRLVEECGSGLCTSIRWAAAETARRHPTGGGQPRPNGVDGGFQGVHVVVPLSLDRGADQRDLPFFAVSADTQRKARPLANAAATQTPLFLRFTVCVSLLP